MYARQVHGSHPRRQDPRAVIGDEGRSSNTHDIIGGHRRKDIGRIDVGSIETATEWVECRCTMAPASLRVA